MDRIDSLYFVQSTRIDLKEETRIKATTEEAQEWNDKNKNPSCMLFIFLIEQHD